MTLPHTPSQQCKNLAELNPTFPPFDGLDIDQMIDACQEHHNTAYGVRSLWYFAQGTLGDARLGEVYDSYALGRLRFNASYCASHPLGGHPWGAHGVIIEMTPSLEYLGDKSKAPSYILERNINGFYLLNHELEYDPDAQARMMNWINQQVLPAYLLHPEILVKPFDIKLEELALDMMGELDSEFD